VQYLRTLDDRFQQLPGYDFSPSYERRIGRLRPVIELDSRCDLVRALRAGEQSAAVAFNRIARRLSARLRDRPSDDSADQQSHDSPNDLCH
jgi:hypothetical protein